MIESDRVKPPEMLGCSGFTFPIPSRYTPTKKTVLSEDHNVKFDNRIAFIDRFFLDIHDDSFLTFLDFRTKFDPSPTLPARGEGGGFKSLHSWKNLIPPLSGGSRGVDLFCESRPQACVLKGDGRLFVHACSQGETLGIVDKVATSETGSLYASNPSKGLRDQSPG